MEQVWAASTPMVYGLFYMTYFKYCFQVLA